MQCMLNIISSSVCNSYNVARLIQITQGPDGTERGRYGSGEKVVMEMKSDQACQVAQGRWYRSSDVICMDHTAWKDEEVSPGTVHVQQQFR